MNQPATRFSSYTSDAFDEISSVENVTLHVNYAHNDLFLSYTATLPRQDPSAKTTKSIHDPIRSYPMMPHLQRNVSQKKKPVNFLLAQNFINLPRKKQDDSRN